MLDFHELPCCSGSPLKIWHLSNKWLRLELFELGASLLSFEYCRGNRWFPLIRGESDPYWRLEQRPYYNAVVGPYANRLAEASFTLGNSLFRFPSNEGKNLLHSGSWGWQKLIWQSRASSDPERVFFSHCRHEGESPFPGTLQAEISFSLEGPRLVLRFSVCCSRDCFIAPIHHPYFNLDPEAESIAGHELLIRADARSEINKEKIPTGRLLPNCGSLFDFSSPVLLGPRLAELKTAFPGIGGLDHNFDTRKRPRGLPQAELYSKNSGLKLGIDSDFPGLQVYSCQDGGDCKRGKSSLPPYFALCLEAQEFPDAPHHPAFPSVFLPAGEVRERKISYTISDNKKEDPL